MKQTLESHLHDLELPELPDLPRLNQQFNRLLKQYHPDINKERADWAHEKTLRLIHSFHQLRNILKSQKKSLIKKRAPRPQKTADTQATWTPSPDSKIKRKTPRPAARPAPQPEKDTSAYTAHFRGTNSEPRPPQKTTPANGPGFKRVPYDPAQRVATITQAGVNYQLLQGVQDNYALPLDNIIGIIGAMDTSIEKGFFGYYCVYNDQIFPLIRLSGAKVHLDHTGYILLYADFGKNYGVVVPTDMTFGPIARFSDNEKVYLDSRDNSSCCLIHDKKYYLYPEKLLRSTVHPS